MINASKKPLKKPLEKKQTNMKKQFIDDIKPGDTLKDLFALAGKNVLKKKDGNAYLDVMLSDRTGSLKGVVWDNVDQISAAVALKDIVLVHAVVSEYRGNLQAVVKDMEPATGHEIDPGDFVPKTDKDIGAMWARLQKMVSTIQTDHFRKLLEAFFADEAFVTGFTTAPAAKKMHHAYIGGLLEHTLSMALLIEKTGKHYGGIDGDLLLTGAVLHDIGKIEEFQWSSFIDYSDKGRLLNHIVIGCGMIDEKIKEIKDFPEQAALVLKHLIVSHHGSRAFGSPEPPKTLEAVLLNAIDDMDAKMNGIREFIMGQDSGESWTPYHRLLERHFYIGK